MSKDFKGGLGSLFGDQTKVTAKKVIAPGGTIKTPAKKVGRPKTQTKVITKSSQDGTKENETRATFIVNEEVLSKLKALAYWERKQIKEVVNEALTEYLKTKGNIKAIK